MMGLSADNLFAIAGIIAALIMCLIIYNVTKLYRQAKEKDKVKIVISSVATVLLSGIILITVKVLDLPSLLWGDYGKLIPRDEYERQQAEKWNDFVNSENQTWQIIDDSKRLPKQ